MANSFRNHLRDETSPYLLQHAGNPVDWYPWCDEALSRARSENRLMVISIGYAACHWCHVMERESFEDPEVAAAMNQFYISVKVDREERPDIDQVYMFAAYAVTGRGGWPLNVIALPDGRPVYAGTYFRKNDWLHLLKELAEIYRLTPAELTRQAEDIRRKMDRMDALPGGNIVSATDLSAARAIFRNFERRIDTENGGFDGAPKFPMPVNLDYLLQFSILAENREALQSLEFTLDQLAAGGIFDHLGGGFARYSTDASWHIPHFEKMLYDNAQLVSIYSRAYRFFRKPEYAEVVTSVLRFVERELASPDGLFYSSLDADSDGEEGAFYRWSAKEIKMLTGTDYPVIRDFYDIREEGNWEEGWNVLHRRSSVAELSSTHRLPEQEIEVSLKRGKAVLFSAREKRNRPATDTKILTAWNAMMISGYVDAAHASGDETLIEKAGETASRLLQQMMEESGKVYRTGNKNDPKNRVNGFLDDYALLIRSCTDLYQATFNVRWLNEAETMTAYALDHFFDSSTGLFFYTSDEDPALISRKKEVGDNVIPASNSVMAANLHLLGALLDLGKWSTLAERMAGRMQPAIETDPVYYAGWAALHLHLSFHDSLICIVGREWKTFHRKLSMAYLPHVVLAGGDDDSGMAVLKGKTVTGKTLAYACSENTCSEPLENPEEFLSLLTKNFVRLKLQ